MVDRATIAMTATLATCGGRVIVGDLDPAEVERRLRGGEWLSTTALAALFGRDRTTIYRWGKRGVILAEEDPVSRDLAFDPESALALLERFRARRAPRRIEIDRQDPPPPAAYPDHD